MPSKPYRSRSPHCREILKTFLNSSLPLSSPASLAFDLSTCIKKISQVISMRCSFACSSQLKLRTRRMTFRIPNASGIVFFFLGADARQFAFTILVLLNVYTSSSTSSSLSMSSGKRVEPVKKVKRSAGNKRARFHCRQLVSVVEL